MKKNSNSIVSSIIISAFVCTLLVSIGTVAYGGSGSPSEIHEESVVIEPVVILLDAEVKVAVPQGSFWTEEVVDYLNSLPDKAATPIPQNAPLSTLQDYDALVVYGNAQVDGAAVLQWVNEGGRLVITPWSLTNDFVPSIGFTAAEPALPANNPYYADSGITDVYTGNPLNISVLISDHPMVKDIVFGSDSVGYERGSASKAGATEIATWNDAYNSTAITYWEYGDGLVVYLNMHYITGDCDRAILYDWGKELLANAIQFEELIEVNVDIKPTSCPNPFNLRSKGVLPVAVLGTENFDVSTIDFATIQLEGVSPIRSNYEDVATPVSNGEECECTTEGPDGFMDLTLKFDRQEIVGSLGSPADGSVIELTLTGLTQDGTPIEGADCILIRNKGHSD